MGASLSLAVFAALVAAITVVASMTVIGAVGLLFYSSYQDEEDEQAQQQQPVLMPQLVHVSQPIDARQVLGLFEEESSLSPYTDPPATSGLAVDPQLSAQFGTPEWTEEEGATEIFSAHSVDGLESEFAFADADDAPTRGMTRSDVARAAGMARRG
ncbi:MAG: hypothetical protein ABMB14_39795 [Myxococcota bacterium]